MSDVVFIDGSVIDAESLSEQLTEAGHEVHVLDAGSDGLEQMAAALAGHSELDAIHLIAPGASGAITLGDGVVDAASLATHGDALAAIAASLAEGADLLVYGGHVADGEDGEAFVDALATALGADVAASTDDASGDGAWELDHQVGEIGTETLDGFVVEGLEAAGGDDEGGDEGEGEEDDGGDGDDGGEDGGDDGGEDDEDGDDGGGDDSEGSDDDDDFESDGGDDIFYGHGGNDHFRGHHFGWGHFIGGEGHDRVSYFGFGHGVHADLRHGHVDKGDGWFDTIEEVEDLQGSDFDDDLQGDDGANHLEGEDGADDLAGGAGDDDLDGGDGEDTADYADAAGGVNADLDAGTCDDGDEGTDTLTAIENLRGGKHGDHLRGNEGRNHLWGGKGGDELNGGADDDSLDGGSGNDRLDGGTGDDAMAGGAGDDTYVVDSADDDIEETSSAADEIDTVLASVTFRLGEHLERLLLRGHHDIDGRGNGLANKLVGNDGDNTLDGAAGADTMAGGDGNDTYIVDNAGDDIDETSADAGQIDTVKASIKFTLGDHLENLVLTGRANLQGIGNALANVMRGNDGDNTLKGNAGNDKLAGGAGDDVVSGGLGNDALSGGKGDDSFRFDTALNRKTNVDKIADFDAADDRFVLDNAVFTKLAEGKLAKGAFYVGTKAHDASDRVIYDKHTGHLYYDADGSGSGAAVNFADVDAGSAMSAADFWIA